ncbi:MAG: hypothetical protein GH145_04455 [Firmicutes bacterium]|nr:hypothetical protein [Bacillota bacterium]
MVRYLRDPPFHEETRQDETRTGVNLPLSLQKACIPRPVRRKVLTRDNYRCVWCGKKEEHRLSHFIQRRSGGKTCEENLVVTCEECKRKRHYDSPSEFISKLKVEEFDVWRNLREMRIKIIRPSGETIEGEVEKLPDPNDKAFYLKHIGNGSRELIFVEPGMRIIELSAGTFNEE